MADSEFVNEQTGETMSLADYVAQQRSIEREITRFDDAIASLRADLKAAKGAREKALGHLRATVREMKILARTSAKRKAVKA